MKKIIFTLAFFLAALTSNSQTNETGIEISVSIFGDTIIKDLNGKVLKTISYDIFGQQKYTGFSSYNFLQILIYNGRSKALLFN